MRADASSFGSIVSPVAAVSSAPPAKRKYTKRKDAAAPNPEADLSATKKKKTPDAALPSPTPFLSPGSAHMPNSTSASPSASPLNPITSPPIHSPTASKPLAKPRLLRSPSTAAMPSSLTACEKLRARIVHFLAAQPLGLPMSTLRVRLGVPPEDMKSTLGVVATYESPGYYNLRPELYTELQIESWKDYNDDDRRRVVGKMTRLGLEVDERLREAYGSTLDPSAQLDTPEPLAPSPDATASAIVAATASPASPCPPASRAAAILAPLLSRPFPPLPDLSSLPDEVPSSMLVVADRDDDPFCESPPLVPAPPTVISDYVQYLTMHTDFLHKHRAYKMIGAWLVFTASVTWRKCMRAATDAQFSCSRSPPLTIALCHCVCLQRSHVCHSHRTPVRARRQRQGRDQATAGTTLHGEDSGQTRWRLPWQRIDSAKTPMQTRRMHSSQSCSSLISPPLFLSSLCVPAFQLKESVERKQRILHVMLRSFKQSLQTYSSQHHLYTMQTIKEE